MSYPCNKLRPSGCLRSLVYLLMAGAAWAPAHAEDALGLADVPAVDIANLPAPEAAPPALTGFVDKMPATMLAQADPPPAAPAAGPPPAPLAAPPARRDYRTFGQQVGAVKWEVAGVAAYVTVVNVVKIARVGSRPFGFEDEGWFGKSTTNLGVDKFAHAYNSYVFSDILYHRIRRKTDAPGAALTAAALGMGLQLYGEFYDGIKKTSGFSWQDVTFNTLGAGFSLLRNSVPGMRDKLDFRLLLIPNEHFYSYEGKEHYEQQRFLLALQLGGFEAFKRSPLRFVELQAGYSARNFSGKDLAEGKTPERRPFVGIGLNLQELLFPHPRSGLTKLGRDVLDYIQLPYTAAHFHY